MTQSLEQTYAARLLIKVPEQNKQTSLIVTLVPQDMVPANGRAKPLADCTLAELRAYADTLEQEVWQAYEQITLLDLDASPEVEVEVSMIVDDTVAPIEDWEAHLLVLPEAQKSSATTPDVDEADQPEKDTAEERAFKAEIVPTADDEDDEQETFAEEEAVAAENETAVIPEAKPIPDPATTGTGQRSATEEAAAPTFVPEEEDVDLDAIVTVGTPLEEEEEELPISSGPSGVITPSKARVRVAGQRRPAGDPTWAAVDILLDEPALRAMQAHALTSLDREVAGVMIGPRPEKQPDGRYLVHIIDAIAAKYTVMHGASVTYTPESWRYLNDALHERYPNETAVMVGWYHTHPGFGIFLSGMDQFIHQNFFTQIWHVAYVLDPRARTSGFFCWDRRKTKVHRHDFAWPDWAAGSW